MSSFKSRKRSADTPPPPPPPVKNPRTDGVDQHLIIGPPSAPVLTRNQQKELLKGMETEFIDQISSCDVKEQTSVMDNLTKSIDKIKEGFDENPMTYTQSLLDSLDEELNNLSISGGSKKMKGGMLAGINPTVLILYLIADAMSQGVEKTKEIAIRVLQKGVQLLEFLSNKDGCTEQFLYHFLGKKMIDFFKFYLLGQMSLEAVKSNPLILLNQLTALLPLVAEYGTKGVGMTIVAAIGYLIYHFVNYYKDKITGDVKDKLENINKVLTPIYEAKSEDVVEIVKSKVSELKTVAKELHNEFTSNMTKEKQQEFMDKIGKNLTEKQRFLEKAEQFVSNFENTMTIDELHKKMKNNEEPEKEGGKKKHRSTQKKKKGTKNHKNKKSKRKTNKKSRKG